MEIRSGATIINFIPLLSMSCDQRPLGFSGTFLEELQHFESEDRKLARHPRGSLTTQQKNNEASVA
jgi:hypothetical protein